MREKIIDIIKNHDWDDLLVVIENSDTSIKNDFKHERDFLDYLDHNVEKFEAEFEGYKDQVNQEDGSHTLIFTFKYDALKRLSSEYIKSLGEDIMIDLNPQEIEGIKEIEESIRSKFKKVVTIDTTKVEPQFYPFETPHTYLREDTDMYTTSHEGVMDNAPTKQDGYITVVKVVK